MMKLAWCLVAHPDKLWVRIMRAKYKCGPNAVPEVRHRSNTSSTWRAISDVWEKVLGNLTWVIRDGLQTRFWKDSWIPHTGCRVEHVAASIPVGELNFSVSHYASNGCWRWDRLLNLLPSFICDRIATIKPALPGCADFPCWGATSDGNFTLKSAYESLFEEVGFDVSPTPLFQKAWEWKGPNRYKVFLWKLAHGRLLTNEERKLRGMAHDDSCSRCSLNPESIMHILRDCDEVRDFWSTVVHTDQMARFFSLRFHSWLDWNLSCKDMGRDQVEWCTFFGVAIYELWRDRNNFVFSMHTNLGRELLFKTM